MSSAQTSGCTLSSWSETDVGRVRDHNEDYCWVDPALNLYVVADGMGGHASGEVASRLATSSIKETMGRASALLNDFEKGSGNISRVDIIRLMESAVQDACACVFEEGNKAEGKRGMGTTIVVLLILGQRGFVSHVGDSRLYLLRKGVAHQLTEDHSLMNELKKRGRLNPETLEKIHNKNAITRAVGVHASVEVDTLDFDVLPGDRYLLCSDGLSGYLEGDELVKIFSQHPDETVAKVLVDHANNKGGNDNITAVVVKVADPKSGMDRLANEINLKFDLLHKMPLFKYLSYPELAKVMNRTQLERAKVDTMLVREGDEGDELFIIISGAVKVHNKSGTLNTLTQGQHFGEMALIDTSKRNASVTTTEDATFLKISRKDFFDIVRTEQGIAVKLLWSFLRVVNDRLRQTSTALGEWKEAETLGQEMLTFDDATHA